MQFLLKSEGEQQQKNLDKYLKLIKQTSIIKQAQ